MLHEIMNIDGTDVVILRTRSEELYVLIITEEGSVLVGKGEDEILSYLWKYHPAWIEPVVGMITSVLARDAEEMDKIVEL